MNARRLIGKTIAKVGQTRHERNRRERVLTYIQFTDGSTLRFVVYEREDGYDVNGIYPGSDPEPNDHEP